MNMQDYIDCVQNIHRDNHNLLLLNTQIHQGMLQLISTPLTPPPAPITRTPVHIVRRTTPTLNYVNLNNFLEPIEVSPSCDQLYANTTMSAYRNITNKLNTACSIRGEPFNPDDIVIQINTCQHIYFVNEFYGWFRNHVNCPLCRRDIRNTTTPDIDLLHEPVQTGNDANSSSANSSAPSTSATDSLFQILSDISYNVIDENLLHGFNFDNGDISLNNRYHDNDFSEMQNDPQVQALQNLTETIANELTNQLQYNVLHQDLSNADIELSLSFGTTNGME